MKAQPKLSLMGAIAALLITACSDSPTAPEPGNIRVSIGTTGDDQDADGYEIVVDSERRFVVAPHTNLFLDSMSAGAHVLTLEAVADNCSVEGDQSRSVTIPSGAIVQVEFVVKCDATGIEIRTRTTGDDHPLAYNISVDAEPLRSANATGTIWVTRLSPGSHTVSLSNGAVNCSVTGDNPATVVVTNREVTPVSFEINCLRADKRIAFVLDSAGLAAGSWIVMATANASVVLPLSRGYSPAWSPDGTRLAYSNADCDYWARYDGYPCTGGLVVVDPETRSMSTPVNGSLGSDPSWSPDGNLIAFSRAFSGTLHLAALDGSAAIHLATPGFSARHPSWSPDGQRIVFECSGRQYADICAINRDGTGFMQLTSDAAFDGHPAWSPNGNIIAFTTNRFLTDFCTVSTTCRSDLALMTPSGAAVTRLTTGFDPTWSSDGSTLVFAGSDGLFTIRADGSDLTRITKGGHREPTWRP